MANFSKKPNSRKLKKGKRGVHFRKPNSVSNISQSCSSTELGDSGIDLNASVSTAPNSCSPLVKDGCGRNASLSPFNQTNDFDTILQGFHEDNVPATKLSASDCYVEERCAFSTYNAKISKMTGRRIVDVQHYTSEIWKVATHTNECNYRGMMVLDREVRYGLVSKYWFKCDKCVEKRIVCTDPIPIKGDAASINKSAVWAFTSVGAGHAQQDEIFSVLSIPSLSLKSFIRSEMKVGKYWSSTLSKAIEEAGSEEYRLALEAGDVDPDGVPYITVIVDGGWCQRSYGHRFTAKSGVAVIIGARTKKILFLGVRNKYCSICVMAANKGKTIDHLCYRNWTGSSGAMEPDIIVEGFNKSESMHGLRYKRVIGDGDSSVYKNILEKVSYGRDVRKIECANHAVKCYTSALHKVAKTGQNSKLLSKSRINRLTAAARQAIKRNAENGKPAAELRKELLNGPKHVFGSHSNCCPSFCNPSKYKAGTLDLFQSMPVSLKTSVYSSLQYLVNKADSMLQNHTSNAAETYMQLLSKFIGHKQFCRSRRGAINRRSTGAGLSQIYGSEFHQKTWKVSFNKSPSIVLKRYTSRMTRKRQDTRRRLEFTEAKAHRKIARTMATPTVEIDYGPRAQQPDYDAAKMDELKREYVEMLKSSASELAELEKRTKEQSSCDEWIEERRKRLTASMAGQIAKMRDTTSVKRLVKSILYSNPLNTPAVQYGKENEKNAVEGYRKLRDYVPVEKAGLFVEQNLGFLAASPDGLVGDDCLLEVKCPKTAEATTFEALATAKGSSFCSSLQSDGTFQLKRKHDYYYQVQIQLLCSGRPNCDFVLWSPTQCHIERITYDADFCTTIIRKLERFFMEAMLPELVQPRLSRNMELREAPYVEEAVRRQGSKSAKRKSEEVADHPATKKI